MDDTPTPAEARESRSAPEEAPATGRGATPVPSGTAELLTQGADRAPWRPNRRLVLSVAVVLLLGAAGGAFVAWRHYEQELDRRAVAALALSAQLTVTEGPSDSSGVPGPGGLVVSLVNGGPAPVEVLGLGLSGPFPWQPTRTHVGGYSTAEVPVSAGVRCGPELYTDAAHSVRVRVQTQRGSVVTRELTLGDTSVGAVESLGRARCGLVLPDEAISSAPTRAVVQGLDLVLRLRLVNTGPEPLVVTRLAAAPGLLASAPLPVSVPARRSVDVPGTTAFTMSVRLLSCRALQEGRDAFPAFQALDQLRATVSNAHVTRVAFLSLSRIDGIEGGHTSIDASALISSLCPA